MKILVLRVYSGLNFISNFTATLWKKNLKILYTGNAWM